MTGRNCIDALKALGEEKRMRMFRLLSTESLSVNEISKRLKVSQYNTSKHLRIMREAGLLTVAKHGRNHLYAVVPAFKTKPTPNNVVLDLGCCTFRLGYLPK